MKQPMEHALQIARTNLKKIRTVTEWAEKMGYNSPNYFSNRFKKQYGISPKPRLIQLRIEKFKELIRENAQMSCFEIGIELGIGDDMNLNKYINNHTGKSPKEWRNG